MGNPKHPMPVQEPVVLEIVNHGFADVDVYAVPSPSRSSAERLTTVSGSAKVTVRIREMQLQPGNTLQVELRPIGSRNQWFSQLLTVSPGERVMLEINSDANGGMNRTLLYPLPDQGNN